MPIQKRILIAARVRRPPESGFSWIDRRFLREFAVRLSGDAVFLYLFLTAVSDKHGLSYYADTTLALRLRTSEDAGREEGRLLSLYRERLAVLRRQSPQDHLR
jgi:hypothetical protein